MASGDRTDTGASGNRTHTGAGVPLGQAKRPGGARMVLHGVALAAMLLSALVFVTPALAAPWWRLSARAAPTYLAPGKSGLIDVSADDLGDTGITGVTHEVTIKDLLPVGLAVSNTGVINAHRARAGNRGSAEEQAHWSCSVAERRQVSCSTQLAIPPYELFEVEIPVQVEEPAGTNATLPNQASVEGGESEAGVPVASASLTRPVKISDQPVTFGVEEGGYVLQAENEDGSLDTQAGSHPFQLTSTLDFNQVLEEVQEPGAKTVVEPAAPGLPKNLSVELPPGLLGNVTAAEQCSEVDFSALKSEGNSCPAGSAVGVATVTVLEPSRAKYITKAVPLFNLEPEQGEPARFGFEAVRVPVILDTNVRTGGDYGVTVTVTNATEAAQVLGAQVTFWGTPGSQSHDNSRGWACLRGGAEAYEDETCQAPEHRATTPLLTLPTSCNGRLVTTTEGDSWTGDQLSAQYTFQNTLNGPLEHLENCAALPFEPSLTVQPEQSPEEGRPQQQTSAASTPTGLNVSVKVAQQGTLGEHALADADVNSASVTLPPGLLLNPSAANGLEACSETQVGYLGEGGEDPLSPHTAEPMRFSSEKATCPEASKVGIVHIKTPLLDQELQGSVYLAAPAPNGEPGQNPFNSLIALYIVAENPKLGLRVKLAGHGNLNEQTGQVSTVFQNTPQVPFSELKLQLFGGPRASMGTPAFCGSYTAATSFSAWSGASADPGSETPFQITSGPGGGPCPSDPLPFAPAFNAGSENLQAGGFTRLVFQIERSDGQQPLTSIEFRLPQGISALLARTAPCQEPPPGREWSCGSESQIGYINQLVGLGDEPVPLTGKLYLTTGYDGAPFGVLAQTLAKAGPFDLGMVNVRSKIEVDPHTAQVTVQTDPGPRGEAIPTILKGVPADIRRIEVVVNRPEFQLNPTNCSPMKIEGSMSGAEGAETPVSSPFQVANCADLPFTPSLTATTNGHASKADGTAFVVKVASKGLGQANIAKVDLQLPKQLPARLPTIQKACLASVFEANPAACDEGSLIGTATIHTSVLKNPLSGPAYLVSHGDAAFPDVEFVLQGEGITLLLDGKTQIKHGITYSKFESSPDAPFTTFETVLPAGPHSVLTANVAERKHFDLCGETLEMPTTIVGQNGARIEHDTRIAIGGCGAVKAVRVKKLTRAQKLARALETCRHKYEHSPRRRQRCEKQAHRRYAGKIAARKRKIRASGGRGARATTVAMGQGRRR